MRSPGWWMWEMRLWRVAPKTLCKNRTAAQIAGALSFYNKSGGQGHGGADEEKDGGAGAV